MALNQYFTSSFILFRVEITQPEELFEKFAEKAYTTNLIIDKQQFFDQLVAQEKKHHSGMENEIAIPHIRTELARKSFLMIATLKNPVNFGSLDNSLSRLIVLLCSPPSENQIYIQLLARISRLLQRAENRQAVINSIGPNSIYKIVETRGNWNIVQAKAEKFMLNLTIFRDEMLDNVIDCFLDLGLFNATIVRNEAIKNYVSQKLSVLSNTEFSATREIIGHKISCVVTDKEIVKTLFEMLQKRDLDLNANGNGFITLTKIELMMGEMSSAMVG